MPTAASNAPNRSLSIRPPLQGKRARPRRERVPPEPQHPPSGRRGGWRPGWALIANRLRTTTRDRAQRFSPTRSSSAALCVRPWRSGAVAPAPRAPVATGQLSPSWRHRRHLPSAEAGRPRGGGGRAGRGNAVGRRREGASRRVRGTAAGARDSVGTDYLSLRRRRQTMARTRATPARTATHAAACPGATPGERQRTSILGTGCQPRFCHV